MTGWSRPYAGWATVSPGSPDDPGALNPWSQTLLRPAGLVLGGLSLAVIFGHPWAFLAGALALELALQLRQVVRLYRWLVAGGSSDPPDAHGLWGEIFHQLYLFKKRNRSQKKKLTAMLGRFQEATTAMPDAAVVLNREGAIEWFNDAATRLLGLRPGQDVGLPLVNLVRRPDLARYLSRGEYGEPLEIIAPTDDRRELLVHVIPYGRDLRLVLARDVSQRRRLERMRRDFVANVSHELRTPLTVVRGYLETLQEDLGEDAPEARRQALDQMDKQTARMVRIVEDLLLLARLEAADPTPPEEPVAVPSLLAGICMEAAPLARRRGHRIVQDVDEGLWLRGDERQLHSAFSNLVFNALRYMPEPGRVTLRWHRSDGGARLDVEDTGIGIAPQHLPRLTERFYRVDVSRSRETGGTGLGLAIVKHVLAHHGARLEIRSTPGQGSCFSCLFPPRAVIARPQAHAT